jgi:hypothetical protein
MRVLHRSYYKVLQRLAWLMENGSYPGKPARGASRIRKVRHA